jgi:tetratricopeptide (TPR) repeat protein
MKNKALTACVAFLISGVSTLASATATHPVEAVVVPSQERLAIATSAKAKLDSLVAKNDKSRASLIEQARLSYFIGQYGNTDEEKLAAYEHGVKLLEPFAADINEPEAALIWAANAGGMASVQRNLDALRLMEKIEKRLIAVSEKHPAYEAGAANRALAGIYLNAPRFISVGSKKKAAEYARKAFAQDPQNPANMLIMAHIAADDGDEQKAVELYQSVLVIAKPDRYPLDYAAWHNEAVEGLDDAGVLRS